MKKQILLFITIILALSFQSCNKDIREPYNTSFIHIMLNESSATTIAWNVNAVSTYSIYLSSAPLKESVTVVYDIIAGDGLTEGVDYEIVNKSNSVVFLPGIYDMPIRIKWLPNPIDVTKNNSLKIRLISNNKGINLGLPGPDKLQTEFTITKVK